ncbi:hypothetical protein L596_022884 [Steinernema carpocapsae]|uniref:Uncharacterized protein n=1 Tax=Steinernema carpocapsae TaxID=34508 RepID=A0A4U5MC47_STECR|nr:hypothetical protein L596_022884 [Steinernema carpocapsae]
MSEDDLKGPSKEEITNDKQVSMEESKKVQTTQLDMTQTEGKEVDATEKKKEDKKTPSKQIASPGGKVEDKTNALSVVHDGVERNFDQMTRTVPDNRLLTESTAASIRSMNTQDTKEDPANQTKLTNASTQRASCVSGRVRAMKDDLDRTQNSMSAKAKLKR